MRRYTTIIALVAAFALPLLAHAAVRITEVAWMGSAGEGGQYGEWIELYNDGDTPVDMAGWTLTATDQAIFTLAKTIPANSYLLVERTTASMTDPVPGVNDEAGTFGGGGLSNAGEALVLKDKNGTAVDTLSFASGWPAGDAATKETMQLRGNTWITAPGTPKGAAPVTGGADTDNGNDDSSGTDGDIDEQEKSSAKAPSVESTGAPTAPRLTLTVPETVFSSIEYTFTPQITLSDGRHPTPGPVYWNMGDGTTLEQQAIAPITYRYQYPGTYTVWISIGSPAERESSRSVSKTIKVISPELSLRSVDGQAVEITNKSSTAMDLSSWRIVSSGQYAIIPLNTILAPKASITLSASTLGFTAIAPDVTITRPSGEALVYPLSQPQSTTTASEGTASIRRVSSRVNAITTQASLLPLTEQAFAQEVNTVSSSEVTLDEQTKKRTTLFLGVAALVVIGLLVLVQRVMAKQG